MVKSKVNTHIFLYSSFFLPLISYCQFVGSSFYYVLLAAKRTKSPGTRDVSVGCCFVRKLPWQHFSVTSNLVTKVFSFAFWVLRNDRASEYNASLLANCKRAQPVVGEANLTSVHTVLALFPKSKRPFVVLLTVPVLFINYYCYGFC